MTKRAAGSRKILVADDDEIVRGVLEEALLEADFEVVSAHDGQEALALLSDAISVAVLDLRMPHRDGLECLQVIRKQYPDIETIICTASGDVSDAVRAMKDGAFEYLTKPVNIEELVELVERALASRELKEENRRLRQAIAAPRTEVSFIAESPPSRQLLKTVERVAPLDSTVLITGESGVGKGLLARLIHSRGPRATEPFVTVSCTALPRDLVEAELFGHEKGAFTGAHDRRPGRVEVASGGTLFLDEVGDLPLDLQPKLLTFLQDRSFHRIGGNRTIEVDVRVIAATHQDLKALCKEKKFREDLYFRLNVLPLHVPPLRERKEDLAPLIDFLLERIAKSRNRERHQVADKTIEALFRYAWPGNVRELENVLERVTAFADGDSIQVDDLPPELHDARPAGQVASIGGMKLMDIERIAIIQTLELCRGNKSKAARTLGISEKSIYNKMKRLGI